MYNDSDDRTIGSEPVKVNDDDEYEIEKIVAERKAKGKSNKKQYLCRWIGWAEEYDS